MAKDGSRAREYVESIDLTGTPRALVPQDAAAAATDVFDEAKAQARVVGSSLFSFAQGVTAETREAISQSALLAQLVANKRSSADKEPTQWYATYQDVLANIGWVLQDHGWTDYTARGTAVEVHGRIIEVLTAALGPSAAALTIIKSAVDALAAMAPSTSWLRIFSRESQRAEIARFQIGFVETGEAADVYVSMLACLIQARTSVTQVLFFRVKDENATFKANSAKVSIDRAALTEIEPTVRAKVRAYQLDYVSSIRDI
jgi:hypothetical protein